MAEKRVDMRRVERLGIAARPPQTIMRHVLLEAVAATIFGALFPSIHHRLRWVARAGPRALAIYLVARTAFLLSVDGLMRWSARNLREVEEFKKRLGQERGREPSEEEFQRAWMEEHGFHLPRTAKPPPA